jgi:hypothetical protein
MSNTEFEGGGDGHGHGEGTFFGQTSPTAAKPTASFWCGGLAFNWFYLSSPPHPKVLRSSVLGGASLKREDWHIL